MAKIATIHMASNGSALCSTKSENLTEDASAVTCKLCLRKLNPVAKEIKAPTVHMANGEGSALCGNPKAKTLATDLTEITCKACLKKLAKDAALAEAEAQAELDAMQAEEDQAFADYEAEAEAEEAA